MLHSHGYFVKLRTRHGQVWIDLAAIAAAEIAPIGQPEWPIVRVQFRAGGTAEYRGQLAGKLWTALNRYLTDGSVWRAPEPPPVAPLLPEVL